MFEVQELNGIRAYRILTKEGNLAKATKYLIESIQRPKKVIWIHRIEIEQTCDYGDTGEVWITAWCS